MEINAVNTLHSVVFSASYSTITNITYEVFIHYGDVNSCFVVVISPIFTILMLFYFLFCSFSSLVYSMLSWRVHVRCQF